MAVIALVFLYISTMFLGATHAQDCRGGFDVYFVLDASGSMRSDLKWENATAFVRGVVNAFSNRKTRFAIFSFEGTNPPGHATTWLRLTNNRITVRDTIDSLPPPGNAATYIGTGIQQSLAEMRTVSGTIPILLVVTDGVDSAGDADPVAAANTARGLGANVFSIGIAPDLDQQQLTRIASKPSSTFVKIVSGASLSYSSFVNEVVNAACIEVSSVSPDHVCVGQSVLVNVTGMGFSKNQDSGALKCRFGDMVTPATYLSPTRLSCQSPIVNESQIVYLEVEIFANAATQSNVTFHFIDCLPEVPFNWMILAYIAAALIPFLLFLLWFLWPLLFGGRKKKEEPAKPVPPPPLPNKTLAIVPPVPPIPSPSKTITPTKKWAMVDTSKYVWSREGGTARPLPVKWGDLGPTLGASHLEGGTSLEITYDETTLGGSNGNVQTEACQATPPLPPTTGTSGTSESFCQKVGRCCFQIRLCCVSSYTRCADLRPQRKG